MEEGRGRAGAGGGGRGRAGECRGGLFLRLSLPRGRWPGIMRQSY